VGWFVVEFDAYRAVSELASDASVEACTSSSASSGSWTCRRRWLCSVSALLFAVCRNHQRPHYTLHLVVTTSQCKTRRLSAQSNAIRLTERRSSLSLSVDNESALTPADVNSADRYSHYSARLSRSSRHAKDAFGEMKFLRRQSTEATMLLDGQGAVPDGQGAVIGGNAISDGTGLTSLSTGLTDNQPLPAAMGRRRTERAAGNTATQRQTDRDREGVQLQQLRRDTVAAAAMSYSKQQVNNERETGEMDLDRTMYHLSSSDCRLPDGAHCHGATRSLTAIPHVLHQTSDQVTVSTQVRPLHIVTSYVSH